MLFWKSTVVTAPASASTGSSAQDTPAPVTTAELVPVFAALAMLAALAALAGPVAGYFEATALQLFDHAGYIESVLGTGRGE